MSLNRTAAFIFHSQSLLLIPAIFFLWQAFTALYGYSLNGKDLISHTGNLIHIDTVFVGTPKAIKTHTNGLFINLALDSKPSQLFRTVYSHVHYYVLSRLKRGEKVTVFTEPRLLNNRRRAETIVKLTTSSGRVVIDYSKLGHQVSFNLFLIYLSLLLPFFLLYFFKAKRRLSTI